MSLSVTIADAADGTGGTATIAGSAGGSTNTLYRAKFDGTEGVPLTWASMGSRTGDGTITITTGPMANYYLWYVSNVSGGTTTVSPVVLYSLTDVTLAAVRTRAAQAIVDRIKLLNLIDIGQKVFLLGSVDSPLQSFPGVSVVRDVVPDQYLGGTNIRDDVGYPFLVVAAISGSPISGSNFPMARFDLWKERIERAFRFQRLPGVIENYTCLIEPAVMKALGPGEDLPAVYQGVATYMTIRAVNREVRGIQV